MSKLVLEKRIFLCPYCKKEMHLMAGCKKIIGCLDQEVYCYNCQKDMDDDFQIIKVKDIITAKVKKTVKESDKPKGYEVKITWVKCPHCKKKSKVLDAYHHEEAFGTVFECPKCGDEFAEFECEQYTFTTEWREFSERKEEKPTTTKKVKKRRARD